MANSCWIKLPAAVRFQWAFHRQARRLKRRKFLAQLLALLRERRSKRIFD